MMRRSFKVWGIMLGLVQAGLAWEVSPASDPPLAAHVLWFDQPAKMLAKPRVPVAPGGTDSPLAREARRFDFHESLPVGNGRLGAMDFGGIELLRVAINESGVWSGGKYDWDQTDARESLPEIRRLIFEDRVEEAFAILEKNFVWAKGTKRFEPSQFGSYQTLGDLLVSFPSGDQAVTEYRRELDVMTGLVSTCFVRGGVGHTRRLVVSKPAEVVVIEVSVDQPGALECFATLARPERAELQHTADGLRMDCGLEFDWSGGEPTRCGALLSVKVDSGTVTAEGDGFRVKGASKAVLLISAGSSMTNPEGWQEDMVVANQAAGKQSAEALISAAMKDHESLMGRCRLDLPKGAGSALPLPQRVKLAQTEEDPQLDALYFQYGRHLLVSSSRADSRLPANLQGIWAEEIRPPWCADFHSNINLQMNYWAAEPTGLGECHLPLMRLIETTAKAGEATAKAYYGAPGWLCHHTQNPWGYSAPSNAHAGSGSTCGAWLCWHIWNHYEYTEDLAFLRHYLPVLQGACEFFLATLVADPRSGALVTCPSNSPENSYQLAHPETGKMQRKSLTYGATYDLQILRSLFLNTAAAIRLAGGDESFAKRLDEVRAKLAPTRLGKDGRILEWIREFEETQPTHRHVSHLWGLHPGTEIHGGTPELMGGARATLEARGDASTGWSMAWKSCFWARLGDGARSHKLFRMLIGRGAPNLMCLHPPFQIDGNFGGTAAVCEMLVQSHGIDASGKRIVLILPALPPSWDHGKAAGFQLPGGHTMAIEWKASKPVRVTFTGKKQETILVHHGGTSREVTLSAGVAEVVTF